MFKIKFGLDLGSAACLRLICPECLSPLTMHGVQALAFVTLFLMRRALSSVMYGFTIFDVADILKFPTQVLLPKLVIYSLDSHTSTEQIIINPNVNLSQISTCFRFVYFAYFRRNCSIPLVRNPCLRLEHTNLKYKKNQKNQKKTPYVWKYMHKL